MRPKIASLGRIGGSPARICERPLTPTAAACMSLGAQMFANRPTSGRIYSYQKGLVRRCDLRSSKRGMRPTWSRPPWTGRTGRQRQTSCGFATSGVRGSRTTAVRTYLLNSTDFDGPKGGPFPSALRLPEVSVVGSRRRRGPSRGTTIIATSSRQWGSGADSQFWSMGGNGRSPHTSPKSRMIKYLT